VCFGTKFTARFFCFSNCRHNTFCESCIRQYVHMRCNDKNVSSSDIRCPIIGCTNIVAMSDWRKVLSSTGFKQLQSWSVTLETDLRSVEQINIRLHAGQPGYKNDAGKIHCGITAKIHQRTQLVWTILKRRRVYAYVADAERGLRKSVAVVMLFANVSLLHLLAFPFIRLTV
jgi:hypothetical protein